MSTFLQLQDEVLAHGFESTVYRDRVKNWINEGQARIARSVTLPNLHQHGELTTVAEQARYDLNADFIRMLKVYHRDMLFELNPVDVGQLRATIQESFDTGPTAGFIYEGVQGLPEVYCLFPTIITGAYTMVIDFAPVPDSEYLIAYDYYGRPTTLSSDPQLSAIPTDYHDLMVTYALSKAYRAEDDAQMSQFYTAEFMRDLQRMAVDVHGQVAEDHPRLLPGTWGGY